MRLQPANRLGGWRPQPVDPAWIWHPVEVGRWHSCSMTPQAAANRHTGQAACQRRSRRQCRDGAMIQRVIRCRLGHRGGTGSQDATRSGCGCQWDRCSRQQANLTTIHNFRAFSSSSFLLLRCHCCRRRAFTAAHLDPHDFMYSPPPPFHASFFTPRTPVTRMYSDPHPFPLVA